jgi:hypothetical protein
MTSKAWFLRVLRIMLISLEVLAVEKVSYPVKGLTPQRVPIFFETQ